MRRFVHCNGMRNAFSAYKRFVQNLGAVEQAQVVASTAVIVSMATIITAVMLTEKSVRLMDFISILTVGTIGFTSVYFTLRYGRQLEAKRRQLFALNTITEAINRVVELDYVLQTALEKVTELLRMSFGWIYLLEGDRLVLKSSKGTAIDFLSTNPVLSDATATWLHQPRVQRERVTDDLGFLDPELKQMGIQFWASVPLRAKDTVAGTLVVAGKEFEMFTSGQAEMMEAFGNQISVALNNAQLFERLRQSEKQYVDLFENAPDIYLSVDHSHIIVGCNKIGANILGYTKDEIVGKPFEALFVSDRQSNLQELISKMFADGKGVKDVEEQMVLKNGSQILVNLNSSLVFDDEGATVNARILGRDITERKKMEETIRHAQKIDSIGNLAGGIAHDFNNVLASILGSASIMRRRISEEKKMHKYVEIIENAARRGSSLTRQLLTFARKTDTAIKPVDVNSIVEETLDLFQRSVDKEIVVETRLTSERTSVKGDKGQIQQALLNLFLNARDAMPNGGVLTITTDIMIADAHTTSQFTSINPGPFVLITVSDTGIGMDNTTKNRVFEPFFTTKDSGTGLGLSVLYGVVQNHGGFINLQSEVNRGTTFSICFPRVAALPKSTGLQRQQNLPRGRENILIIDDEVSLCEIARDMLVDLGYSVSFAYDGKTGVQTYKSRQALVDLVLLDVNMPLMGGRATFEQLRTINPSLQIIILTGYGEGVIETPTFSNEVDGFLQKPFHVEDLATKVRQVLDSRKAPT